MLSVRNLSILVVIIASLISCKKVVKTGLPMEEEKAISIMGDMHFASSAAMIHQMDIRDSMKSVYESQVFEIHEITKQEYEDLITALEVDLNLYYEIEKKVHKHLKDVQNEKK